ncbi:MAG: hypothetical protein IKJ14_03860 [Clostridia bacterium]|nr:hypothetical protein [Clostridia bacterium]
MKSAIKSNLLKLFALVVAVCAGVAIATLPGLKKVSADEEAPAFTVEAEFRANVVGELDGLNFKTSVNDAWLEQNNATEIGTIVFPAPNAEKIDLTKTDVSEINKDVDGIRFIANVSDSAFSYNSSIIFDPEVIKGFDGVTEENLDSVMQYFYAATGYVAFSYAYVDGNLVWCDSPVFASMAQVALKYLDDPVLGEKVKAYIPVAFETSEDKAYISKEDGVLVVKGDFDPANVGGLIIDGKEFYEDYGDGEFYGEYAYTVVDGSIVLNVEDIKDISGYKNVHVVNYDGDTLTTYNVLFADKALKDAADVEEAFVYGNQKLGDTFGANNNVYVLANDIDMSDVVVYNKAMPVGTSFDSYTDNGDGTYTYANTTTTTADFGFHGIFDGMGYSISNITVSLTNLSLGQPIVTAEGGKSWKNASAFGFFTNVAEEAEIRNVAFINVKDNGSVTNGYGLTGVLGNNFFGTLENVYIDINVNTIITRGPFAQYGATTVLKNVVVNFPRAAGYSIESHLALASNTFAYGNGALSGQNSPISTAASYQNVLVSSAMPINFYTAGNTFDKITSVTYAENETDLMVLFDYAEGTTIAEALEAEKELVAKKTVQLKGVRRYDDLGAMAQDSEYVQALIDTGLFKVAGGKVLWHSQTVTVDVNDAIDFDAADGKLLTSMLDGQEIVSATANGAEVQYVDGKFVGVPVLDNHNSSTQSFVMTVVTNDAIYSFNNVIYWASVINNPTEFQTAIDIDYAVTQYNFGFYKLGNDIDIEKASPLTFAYANYSSVVKNRFSAGGFAGVFDGCGYALDFNQTWLGTAARSNGIFGNLNTSGGADGETKNNISIRNLAIVNIKQGAVPSLVLFGKFGKNHDGWKPVVIENVYINSIGDVPGGLFYDMGTAVKLNNVYINLNGQNTGLEYNGAILSQILRTTSDAMIANVTNFVTLGNPIKTTLTKSAITAVGNKWVKSADNGDGTFTHTISHGGWGTGNTFSAERYYAYAGGNREYGSLDYVQGLKAEFAEIAKNYNKSTAIPGYYCATCGETFSLTAGNCDKCEGEVALTESANLWNVTEAYVVGKTKLSTVVNADCHTGANGELVFYGAYQYDTLDEMKTTGNFASFVGEAGNNMWAVNEGVLTWVGAQA